MKPGAGLRMSQHHGLKMKKVPIVVMIHPGHGGKTDLKWRETIYYRHGEGDKAKIVHLTHAVGEKATGRKKIGKVSVPIVDTRAKVAAYLQTHAHEHDPEGVAKGTGIHKHVEAHKTELEAEDKWVHKNDRGRHPGNSFGRLTQMHVHNIHVTRAEKDGDKETADLHRSKARELALAE